MFCQKCGAELKAGQRFCGKCGAKQEYIEQPPQTPGAQNQASNIRNQFSGNPNQSNQAHSKISSGNMQFSFASLKSNPVSILYIVSAVLFLLQTLLWFVDSIKVSYFGYYSFSFFEIAQEIDGGVLIVMLPIIVLNIIALIMCFLPFFMGTLSQRNRLILPKISAIYSAVWFFMLLVEYLSQDYITITFGGVLLLLVHIGLIAVLFILSAMTKKISNIQSNVKRNTTL